MLFFQNRFAVRYFFKYLFEHGRDVRDLAHLVICTSNRLAATELLEYGIIPDCCLESETPTGIAGMLRKEGLTGQRILLPGAEHVDELVAGQLREGGNEVTPLAVYVHGAQDHVEAIDLDFIDEIYFASPECVRKFRELYESIPSRIKITPADERTAEEVQKQFGV